VTRDTASKEPWPLADTEATGVETLSAVLALLRLGLAVREEVTDHETSARHYR
jgi:hypothetical protein